MQQVLCVAEPEVANGRRREDALVADVVNREDRARPGEQAIPGVNRAQVERRERRVPVVAMKDVRREPEALTGLERRACQQQKAQVLVRSGAIDARSVVQGRAVHQVDWQWDTWQP